MINSTYDTDVRDSIVRLMREEYEEKSALHEPSGKMSASQLGKPILEQVLKIIGVPQKPVDDYTLGLFRRGDSVEQNLIELMKPDEAQKEIEYKGVVGLIDAIKNGRIYEIKSIKNSQYKYLDPENIKQYRTAEGMAKMYKGVKRSHALQAGLYALAEGKDEFTIIYASADDLRTIPHTIKVDEVKDEINNIIDEVNKTLEKGVLPPFVAKEGWQTDARYSSYPEWISLSPETAMIKLKNQYPDAYKKLTKGVK